MGMTNTKFDLPHGFTTVGREEQRLPPEYMQMLVAFAETSAVVDLGLHCSRCKENVVGRNGPGDRKFIMDCACRTFIGANPLVHQ